MTLWWCGLGLLLGACVGPVHAAFLAPEELPTDSPLYFAIEDLSSRYRIEAGFPHTRPWNLATVSRFLEALRASGCVCDEDPSFVRLRREIDPAAAGYVPLVRLEDERTAMELSPYVRLRHREDGALEPSVVRDHRIGAAAAVGRRDQLLAYADYYLATYSPESHGNPITGTRHAVVEGTDFNLWFDRAFLAVATPDFDARLAHTWLRWGPGSSGTLGLSDGTLALDVAEFRWRLLSRAQAAWFVAALDPYEEEYLAGHRIEIRFGSSVLVGLAELARFSGASLAPLYLLPVVGFTQREKQVSRFSDTAADSLGLRSRNNVLWTGDLEWRVASGATIYGELLLDDFSLGSDYRPTEMGYQLGARWTRRMGSRDAAAVRFEHTRITNFTYSSEHGHDFASDGYALGYPLGPDVEAQHGALTWTHGPDWVFAVQASRVRRGEGRIGEAWQPSTGEVDNFPLSGVVERSLRVAASTEYSPSRRVRARAEVGWTTVANFRHRPGWSVDRWFGTSALVLQW